MEKEFLDSNTCTESCDMMPGGRRPEKGFPVVPIVIAVVVVAGIVTASGCCSDIRRKKWRLWKRRTC